MICWLINTILCSLYKKEYERYAACEDIKVVQEKKLKEILEKNKNTLYGKKYSFDKIKNPEEYREKVPLTKYEDYLEYIEMIKKGEKNILTEEDVKLLELTSGSMSASKLIPYTEGLKREFQAGIKPWIYSLYSTYPEIKKGKSYWSVTPVTSEKRYTSGGIPIGFEEDSEYFGKIEKHLMDMIFASPKDIKLEKDMEKFYWRTALKLLETDNLTLISVWSPTFLLLLIEYIEKNSQKLLENLSVKRRKSIENYLIKGNYSGVWNKLKVISCWGDGNAAHYLEDIKRYFKGVVIQPKGILATEGFLSFPIGDEEGSRISYYSHFFEFIDRETGEIKLAHQLEAGRDYEVVLTTSGGLYRYCIGDIIKVIDTKLPVGTLSRTPLLKALPQDSAKGIIPLETSVMELNLDSALPICGCAEGTSSARVLRQSLGRSLRQSLSRSLRAKPSMDTPHPIIKFIGRKGAVSDLFGEKISEEFAEKISEELGAEYFMTAPEKDRYRVYLKSDRDISNRDIDEMFRKNFHYDYCRKLGQLKEIEIFVLTGEPEKEYINHCLQKGQRLGDIKIKILSLEGGWEKVYKGYLQKGDK